LSEAARFLKIPRKKRKRKKGISANLPENCKLCPKIGGGKTI
jgi:hypothetical protein